MRQALSKQQILLAILVLALLTGTLLTVRLDAHEGHGAQAAAVSDPDAPKRVTEETAALIGLKTTEVDFGPIEEVLRLSGIVHARPDRVQILSSPVAGRIRSVKVEIGDAVKRGDLLVEIESAELAKLVVEARKADAEFIQSSIEWTKARSSIDLLQLQMAANAQKASLAEAELTRGEANKEAMSANVLAEKKSAAIVARSESNRAELESKLARQTVASLESHANSLKRSAEAVAAAVSLVQGEAGNREDLIGRIELKATIDGVVTARNISAGQGIEPNAALVQVADFSEVQVHGEIPESEIDRLDKPSGKAVRIYLSSPDAPVTTGTLRFISPEVDQMKRTLHAIIIASNKDGSLRDGMYVSLAVVLRQQKNAVVVPPSAILQDGPVHFVFVKEGQVYKKKEITPGARSDQFVEIKKGLVPGDVIVTQGAYSVSQLRGTSAVPAKEGAQQSGQPPEMVGPAHAH